MSFAAHKRKWVFFFVFVSLLVLTFFLFKPYLSAIVVGALIAYFVYPLYQRFVVVVKSKLVAQVLFSVGAALLLGLLVAGIAIPLASQAQSLYLKSGQLVSNYIQDFEDCTNASLDTPACRLAEKFSPFLESAEFKQRTQEIIEKTSFFFYEKIGGLLSGIVSFLIFLVVMVFSLFYFLDHGTEIKNMIVAILPLSKSDQKKVVQRLEESINAVVGGNISMAFLQGVAAALIFFLLGVPVPIFWGLVISVLAFIPGLGPAIVWVPLSILLIIKGSMPKALILIAYSIIVLGSIENILKPKFIGDKIKMSTYAVFMGVLGGLHLFGIIGFFFGPILLALLVTCIQIYREMDGNLEE